MIKNKKFDVIIIGGSYSGLSAAMALGRSLKQVLIIDSGKPCNSQTPHSHNFLTQDGKTPKEISMLAKKQVEKYETVIFYDGLAIKGKKTNDGFEIETQTGDLFLAKKIIFATGIKDIMQDIEGLKECWGISIIHCPYCHGYEVKNEKTGILGNGDYGFDFSKMIHNWTKDLTLYTNGKSTLTKEQTEKLENRGIKINENEIERFEHNKGEISRIIFKDNSYAHTKALYVKLSLEQHCHIPVEMGCELSEQGLIKVDSFQKTSVDGIFACGDNTTLMRTISTSVATGTMAGAVANKEIIEMEF